MQPFSLTGRRIAITGAAGGIGSAAARICAELGATVRLSDLEAPTGLAETLRGEGIDVPIVPGIMPVLNLANLERIASLSPGTTLPPELCNALKAAEGDDEASLEAGVDFAAKQCRALIAKGAPGIHFYTLNRSKATLRTVAKL